MLFCARHVLFSSLTGAGRPTAWPEQSQVVVETVTKTSTTQKFASVQSMHESDATKVTATGSGLQRAMANKETTFTVDTSRAGQFNEGDEHHKKHSLAQLSCSVLSVSFRWSQ